MMMVKKSKILGGEKQVVLSQEEVFAIINLLPLPAIITETDGLILHTNIRFLKLLDCTETDCLKGNIENYIRKAKDNNTATWLEQNSGGNIEDRLIVLITAQKMHLGLSASVSQISIKSEEKLFWLFRSISKEEETKKEIEQREQYLKSIFKAAPVGIGLVVNRIIYFVNEKICELTGFSSVELLGKSAEMLYPDETEFRRAGEVKYEQIRKTGSGHVETVWKCKDGTIKQILLSSAAIDPGNLLKGVTFTVLDITEQKEAEKKYLLSENKYKKIIETAPDAILIADIDTGILIEANKQAHNLLGYEQHELIGMHQSQIHPPEIRNESIRIFNDLATGESDDLVQTEVLHKSGRRIQVEINSAFLKDDKNKTFIIGFFRDLTQRIESQKNLEKSEKKYQQLFNEMATGFAVHEMLYEGDKAIDYRFLEANPAFERITGLKIKDIINKTIRQVMPGIEDKWIEQYDQVARTGIPKTFNDFIWPLGKHFEIVAYSTAKGQFATIFSDITENVNATKNIKESEERYRKLVESSPIMITVLKGDAFIYSNPTALRVLGYSSLKELQKRNTYDLIHEDYKTLVRERMNHVDTGVGNTSIELKFVHKNKSEIIVESISIPIVYDNRDATLIMAIDITEKRKIENAIRDTEEIIQNIQAGIASKVGEKFFETIVLSLAKILHADYTYVGEFVGEDRRSIKTISLCAGGKIIDNIVYRLDNTPCDITIYGEMCTYPSEIIKAFPNDALLIEMEIQGYIGMPLKNSMGEIVGVLVSLFKKPIPNQHLAESVIGIFTSRVGAEIERRKTLQDLLQAKEKAEESDRLKSTFLANMSHEIRTPMNAIVGFANLLQREDVSERKRHHYINVIQKRSDDLLNIINDVLDISRIESGQIKIVKENFSVNQMLNELYEEFDQKIAGIEGKNIGFFIENTLQPEYDLVLGDMHRINQIIGNLLDNAIKFTEQGHVCFGCIKEENDIKFYVADTGIGIPVKAQQTIFERFRQAEEGIVRKYGGNGLGLAICKALVELMDGKIWLTSVSDQGTTFYFTIPLISSTQKPKESKEYIDKSMDLSGITILVVEDDPLSVEYLKDIIEQINAFGLYAVTGKEALKIVQSDAKIDLILMDIQLPDINGLDVTMQIRKVNKTIPILAQTAYAMFDDRAKSIDAGCNDYIAKPININDLFKKIQKLLKMKTL